MQKTKETWVWSLGQEYSWRRKLHSFNNLVWRILWTEEPGGEQSMDLQRVGHNWVSEHSINNLCLTICHGILNIYFKYLYNICSGNRDQIANICWIMKKAREFQKNIYFCFIDYAKAFDCVDHNKLENSSRDGNTRPPNRPLEKPICRSGSNSWNWTWKNRLVPNRKRSTSRLYIVTLLI